MQLSSASLTATVASLRNETLGLGAYIERICARLDEVEPAVRAFLPEAGRRERLRHEAE